MNSVGVRKFQPRVEATLGFQGEEYINAESVRERGYDHGERFQR